MSAMFSAADVQRSLDRDPPEPIAVLLRRYREKYYREVDMTDTPPRADSDMFPWAQSFDSVWHKRPTGTEWIIGDDANTETVCGQMIPSVNVSSFEPEGVHCPACREVIA